MSVYIGELHTEVVPLGGPSADDRGNQAQQGGSAAARALTESHREARERADWLAARVAAEGFDD
ncbi:hypothetical protein [Streptomyces sp. NPDC057199]|uniref:hypothetical protein n=1 Tax=Streptomyces sp. NPDC057199 TaxID=3346047 RepID=UPI0036393B71